MSNRLESETSPYLLEHAENPVNWQPWDAEALDVGRPGEEADLSLDWLFRVSLVPRDGAGEFRRPGNRRSG